MPQDLHQYAAQWQAAKQGLVTWLAPERGAAHVIASVIVLVGLALLMRRPISSAWPLIGVFVMITAHEAVSGYADGLLEAWEIAGSFRDILLVMALPTLLLLVSNLAPATFVRRTIETRIAEREEFVAQARQADDIIEVEFEEVA